MKKRIFALLLMAGLLTGCGRIAAPDETEPAKPPVVTAPAEEQIAYDWMAGQSPVQNRRIGIDRGGFMNGTVQAVGDSGTYFIYNPGWILDVTPPSPWILYMDHGSDTVIKLCGRPDCPHNTTDCNAFVDGAQYIHFYNGYLYIIASGAVLTEDGKEIYWNSKLIRMDPDGTNRVELFDFTAFVREQGADFAQCYFAEDYCCFDAFTWETDPDTPDTTNWEATYLYRLDGSMEEPQQDLTPGVVPLYNCGDILLAQEYKGEKSTYCDLDLSTGNKTYLMDYPGTPAYCTAEAGYYFLDGKLHRFTYATGQDEILLETQLTGDYDLLCFPDCFVLADGEFNNENPDLNLYIYNWDYELVDTVKIDYPCDVFSVSKLIMSENPRQIILSGGNSPELPTYYIDKAELGTGNVKLHKIQMPDLEDDQKLQQEEQEDQQWFDEN